jgi:hypothetical protein
MRHQSSTSWGSSSFLAIPHGAFKLKVTFCVTAVFTAVLAKHSKSFSLIDCISVDCVPSVAIQGDHCPLKPNPSTSVRQFETEPVVGCLM